MLTHFWLLFPLTLFLGIVGCENSNIRAEHPLIDITGPIRILSNSDFSAANGVISGDGSMDAPFVISGHEIVVSDGAGISISNTRSHFIIRDVRISGDSETHQTTMGIELNDIQNGVIQDVKIYGLSGTGIMIKNAQSTMISNSSITNIRAGIYVKGAENLLIEDNEIAFMMRRGINMLFPLKNIVVRGNHVHHSATQGVGGEGIEAWGSPAEQIVFENNWVHHISEDGLEFVKVTNSSMIANSSHDNLGQGIDLFNESNQNLIRNNYIYGNGKTGILITNSSGNRILDNLVFKNAPFGIRLEKRGANSNGSIDNIVAGISSWANTEANFVDDTIHNRVLFAGDSHAFPLSSEGQMFYDAGSEISRVEIRFRHFRTEIIGYFEDGTQLETEKRSLPYLNFDIRPDQGILEYEIRSYNRNASRDEDFLDMTISRSIGSGSVMMSFHSLPAHDGDYGIFLDGVLMDKKASDTKHFDFTILLDEGSTEFAIRPL